MEIEGRPAEIKGKSKKPRDWDEDNGFGGWGGYKAAKRAKLLDQFKESDIPKLSNIFEGVAIHVNGLTRPPQDDLKKLMAAHGGEFHMYQVSNTTHIIASNLPNVKIKHLGSVPIVKPSWITESIDYGKLLDYRRYLLYTNQNRTQPKINFPIINKREEIKTASDDNFLQEFYNNSRLHLISTLGAEYKQLINQLRFKTDHKFLGLDKLMTNVNKNSIYYDSVIMHIDMDCFFVSVSLRNRPELKGKPIAVTHARNGQIRINSDRKLNREQEFMLYTEKMGYKVDKIDAESSMSEIASCNYEARKFAIKNGMFLGQAIKLCPDLITLPYDFQGIKLVSHKLYETIASYTLDIEAVSCDEMYVDITKILNITNLSVDEWGIHIRNEIMEVTGCPCSAGFGSNRLQARLATKRAKPCGQFYLSPDKIDSFMFNVNLSELPGVGRSTVNKLNKMGYYKCGDLREVTLKRLQSEFGVKIGETLKQQSIGIDKKPLNFSHERKSISAEVNYGIRFKNATEFDNFLRKLSEEVCNRMKEINVKARSLTLKLLVRSPDAPGETAKFLGHGICDSLTKSTQTNNLLTDPETIYKEAKMLYDKLNPNKCKYDDLRGVGLQLTKLERNVNNSNLLSTFLQKKRPETKENVNELNNYFTKKKSIETSVKLNKTQNKQKDIDLRVLNELPDDIREEIIKEYNINLRKNESNRRIKDCSDKTASTPFKNLNWHKIKPIIKKWIESEAIPLDYDVEIFAEHLKQLALQRNIENLHVIFNCLHRLFEKLNCEWHKAYFRIVDLMQTGMVAKYGYVLSVKRRFQCCEINL